MEHAAVDFEAKRKYILDQLKGYVPDDLLQTFKEDDENSTRRAIESLLATATRKEHMKWKARNPTINKIEDFAKDADNFLKTVNGPSDIIKGAVPMGFGNVVNGTLTLLVKIVAEKKLQDDLIAEGLKNTTSWLRRMDCLKESRGRIPDEFERLVSDIYDKLIIFLCKSIRRLSSKGWKRVYRATLRPVEIKEAIDALKESIADLFQEYSTYQSEQITNIERKISQMDTNGRNVAKASSQRNRNSAILHTAEALELPRDIDRDDMLKECRKAHASLTREKKIWQNERSKKYPLVWGGLRTMETREAYQSWMKNENPCLLLLNGEPFTNPHQRYSWLSPITTELYDSLMTERSAKALFFSGHQTFGPHVQKEDRHAQILWGIAMQALQLELELGLADISRNDDLDMILKRKTAEAKEEVSKNGKMGFEKRLHLIQETLIAALRHLRSEQPLYIILDGIVWESEQRLAIQLVKLVLELAPHHNDTPNPNPNPNPNDDSRCGSNKVPMIKVLAVAKYDQWPKKESEWRRDMERVFPNRLPDLEECVFCDLDWRQEKALT